MTESFFDAIANPYRRKIINLLKWKTYNVGELTQSLSISQPSVSRHLAILKDAGIVSTKRDGTQIYYSLNLTVFQEATIILNSVFRRKGNDLHEV